MGIGGQDISGGGSGEIEAGPGFSAVGTARDIVYFDDFLEGGFVTDLTLTNESDPSAKFCDLADKGAWLATFDVLPTIVIANAEPGGLLVITTGSNTDDFCSCQMNGEAWAVASAKSIYFEARIKVDDADDTRWYIGLNTTDVTGTTVGPILDSLSGAGSGIGFFQNTDAGTDIQLNVQNAGTATTATTATDIVDDTFIVLGIKVDGDGTVEFFINGAKVGSTVTTNIPTGDAMTLSMEVHSPTASSTLEVDYIYCAQQR